MQTEGSGDTPDVTDQRLAKARELAESLPARGVGMVALSHVDNSGVTRVKTVPSSLLERAVRFGIGMSPVFEVFLVDDSITASDEVAGPVGDLRLMPDPFALTAMAAQPGWAWAPVDKHTQEGEVYAGCQRTFAKRMAGRLADAGIEMRLTFELEWFQADADSEVERPIHRGPAYGLPVLATISDYVRDLVGALEETGVGVEQFHPEYAMGQLELSVKPSDPVGAADTTVLVRQTIRAMAARHGMRASFSPVVIAGHVGNGGHVHFSLWREGTNLFAGGDGPHDMTDAGQAFVAGVLAELPALVAIGSPSVPSYLRLVPQHWAGAFACWGRENREAAVRFVTGMVGSRGTAANTEVKCFDLSANPYLVAGAVIAAGLAGMERNLTLPEEVTSDPGAMSEDELSKRGIKRLPQSVEEAVSHLEASDVLRDAMGPMLFGPFVAVRRGEAEAFAGKEPDEIVAAHRWRY
ncbi:MAG: glutamine synthetase family protein [Actinomycetota bacterium]|nr:glutamine synthetase family protein [Actinomycetota bacterium]